MNLYSYKYIPETHNFCEFRKNMIQVANKPFDEVEYKWLVCSIFEALRQKYILWGSSFKIKKQREESNAISLKSWIYGITEKGEK